MFDGLTTQAILDLTASLKESTHTARLLGMLEQRPMSTFELAKGAGMSSRQVWAYLRWHRDRGHVSFDPKCGVWQSNTARMTEAIKRAAALLRSNGWKVNPP